MTYKMFLDDLRDPGFVWSGHNSADWVVCRSYDQAVAVFQAQGWPSMVSFDHDLGPDTPTGMDFARFLVDQDMNNNEMPNGWRFHVHSANPVGSSNIVGLLNGYMQFKGVL